MAGNDARLVDGDTQGGALPIDVAGNDARLVDGRTSRVRSAPPDGSRPDPGAPRISAAEAAERFEALVAQYRAEKPRRERRSAAHFFSTRHPYEVVFLIGIAVGLVLRARPVAALLLGLPLFFFVRALLKRWGRTAVDGD